MKKMPAKLWVVCLIFGCAALKAETLKAESGPPESLSLPGAYFRLLDGGSQRVEKRLNELPKPTLKAIEVDGGWRHFPNAILAPAVLYAKKHPDNPRYRDPKMLALAIRMGDLFADEDEKGTYEPRGDSDWDTYVWLEAYRVLEKDLGDKRRERWKRALLRNSTLVLRPLKERVDFPWYQSPYIGTSPNHYAQYAYLIYLCGRVFDKPDWEALGAKVLRRFAMREQSVDGYWGEHNNQGPTTGYNHLTMTPVAVYWEHSRDQDVLPALRRALDFHKNFTYPNGHPVEVINDRNRRWRVSAWGHFAFSNFPDGRRYSEFLTSFFTPENLSMSDIGRLAQNALYYHEGPTAPIPQDRERYVYQMQVPAGIRKTADWTVCLSGIFSTQAATRQWYLDRQGHLSVFHEKTGLIITGANSKHQSELATFREKAQGQIFYMPISSRLDMAAQPSRLSLAYNTFFTDIYVPEPSGNELKFKVSVTGRGEPPEEAELNLQLVLKAGEELKTGSGKKIVLSTDKIELGPEEIGGWIRHNGWKMQVDPRARLQWPVYPFYPYSNSPEASVEHAVGRLTVPLSLEKREEDYYVMPGEEKIDFTVTVE